jgi:serine protease AprX
MSEPVNRVSCPICRREVPEADYRSSHGLDAELVALAAVNTPGWNPDTGLCRHCVNRFRGALTYLRQEFPRFLAAERPILPTAVRLGAPPRLRGRGVTVAFLDSGFYAHPDLTRPHSRILRYVDINNPKARPTDLEKPDDSSWHGMMTSVVACGNGRLSKGLYRGLASEAKLVLVKVGTASRIAHDDIRRGLLWVIRNRQRYNIRVVNVSCGGDYEATYLEDGLCQAAERATREGILVCAAVGNLGNAPGHPVLPPGSAPSVLTVGGLDDKNLLSFAGYQMYHSSYGPTIDGLQKPEVLAPGIWVAAPVLPGTKTAEVAALLFAIDEARDEDVQGVIAKAAGVDAQLDAARERPPHELKALARARMRAENLVTPHYKHVDGTSFAAPIVTGVAAQMLEANPALQPWQIKKLLVSTARRLPGVEVDRQGWGVVNPDTAVAAAAEGYPEAPDLTDRRRPATERRRGSRPEPAQKS